MTIKHRIQAVVLIILCGIGTATANNKLKLLPRVTPPLVSQDQPAAELELSSAELEASPAALEASLAAWDESPVDLEESPFADDSLQETDLVPAAAETCGDCCDGYGPCDGCGSCDGCGPCDGGDQPDGQDQCEHWDPYDGRGRCDACELWKLWDRGARCESGDQLSDQGCTACVSIWDDPSDCCDYPSHTWAELDYLHWWVQGYAIPPLVTAAPLGSSGALNDPNAVILLGSDRLDSGDRSGARARVGWWFDCCETHGIQVEFFGLEREGTRLDLVSSLPNAILYRPFFNTDPSNFGPDAQQADRISVASSSQLYSGNALYRHNWKCDFEPCGCRSYRIDFLAGYRYLRLDEDLTIRETASFGPNTFDITDRFTADNQFHGGELGVVGNFHRGDWSLELLAKVALGNNHQTVTVWGEEVTTINGLAPSIRSGGLLAQPTNIRSETRNAFAVLPEAGAELGYLLTDNLRLTVGYTILWLSHAVRPGDQIDPLVDGRFLNPNLVPPYTPPATRPAPRFTESSLWAQGIHLGLEWHY